MFIYKDYELNETTLVKKSMRSEHLLYKPPFYGSPAIDKEQVWDKHADKITVMRFEVVLNGGNKKIFRTDKETFVANMVEIDLGFGLQVAMPKALWNIEETQSNKLF